MRAFATLFAIAAAGLSAVAANPVVSRQEAARFGSVSVSNANLHVGEPFSVTYNSTTARYQPEYVDIYIQGQKNNQPSTPYVLLQRNNYSPTQKTLTFETTVPDVGAYETNVDGWLLWAMTTFPYDNDQHLLTQGGISTGLTIN